MSRKLWPITVVSLFTIPALATPNQFEGVSQSNEVTSRRKVSESSAEALERRVVKIPASRSFATLNEREPPEKPY